MFDGQVERAELAGTGRVLKVRQVTAFRQLARSRFLVSERFADVLFDMAGPAGMMLHQLEAAMLHHLREVADSAFFTDDVQLLGLRRKRLVGRICNVFIEGAICLVALLIGTAAKRVKSRLAFAIAGGTARSGVEEDVILNMTARFDRPVFRRVETVCHVADIAALIQEQLRLIARDEQHPVRLPALIVGEQRQDEWRLFGRDGCDRARIEMGHAPVLAVIEKGDAVASEIGQLEGLKALGDKRGIRGVVADGINDVLAQDAPFLAAGLNGGARNVNAGGLVTEVSESLPERVERKMVGHYLFLPLCLIVRPTGFRPRRSGPYRNPMRLSEAVGHDRVTEKRYVFRAKHVTFGWVRLLHPQPWLVDWTSQERRMSFQVTAIYISHMRLPSGLVTSADYADYIFDVDRELSAQAAAWDAYCATRRPDARDTTVYANAIDRLNELKEEALLERSKATSRPG